MDETSPIAWEPVTPRGVAAFARASTGRLWLVQGIVACLVAAAVVWVLKHACFPVVREAIQNLPETGVLRGQRLDWNGESPVMLAEGRVLALSVDLDQSGEVRSPAHLQIEFARTNFFTHSLFGYAEWHYPAGWTVAANRVELEPWWGAREPAVLAVTAAGVLVGLMLTWAVLGWIYAGPMWLIAFYANRDLKLKECWRLAGAALLPGALFMALAIFAYGSGWFDLLTLGLALAVHLVVGWVYLFVSVFFLPRRAGPVSGNPFKTSSGQAES